MDRNQSKRVFHRWYSWAWHLGATCYLDRNYHSFNFDTDEDIQMLLEITYENGVVKEVIDVSDNDIDYFKNENELDTVMANVRHFQAGVNEGQSDDD